MLHSRVPGPYGNYTGRSEVGPLDALFHAETLALVRRMYPKPTLARAVKIDTFIGALKTAGVWAKRDVLYVLYAHAAQPGLLNWKSPSYHTLVPLGTTGPVFTADQGYAGDGTDARLTSTYNPSTFTGSQFTLNSGGIEIYIRAANSTPSGGYYFQDTNRFNQGVGLTTLIARVNDATNLPYTFGSDTGLFHARRTASNARAIVRNGTQVASDTTASTALANTIAALLAGPTGGAPSNGQLSFFGMGAPLSDTEVGDLTTALAAFMA